MARRSRRGATVLSDKTAKAMKHHEEIGVKLGLRFAQFAKDVLPCIHEAIQHTEKKVSFGVTVEFRKDKRGVVVGKAVYHVPRIPTPDYDDSHFVVIEGPDDQLEFQFSGTLTEYMAELNARDVKPEDDGYSPGDNANP